MMYSMQARSSTQIRPWALLRLASFAHSCLTHTTANTRATLRKHDSTPWSRVKGRGTHRSPHPSQHSSLRQTACRYETRSDYCATHVRQENQMNLEFLSQQAIYDQAVKHLFQQRQAALLPRGGGAYRGYCGGCPVGSFIKPRDYLSAMEGVPIRYIAKPPENVPAYMDIGVAALKKALLRSKINVYDPQTVSLLSYLQNVHDVFGVWEWGDRLQSIARQFGLNAEQVRNAA